MRAGHSTLEQVRDLIDTSARVAGIGQRAVGLDTPPGSGKSHKGRELSVPDVIRQGQKVALLVPRVALGLQHYARTGAQLHASPIHAIPGRTECKQPNEIKWAHDLGLSGGTVCRNCPFREGCTARSPVGDPARGVIAMHEHAPKFPDHVLFIDEWPNSPLNNFDLPKTGLVAALERVVSRNGGHVDWLKDALPWARKIATTTDPADLIDSPERWIASQLNPPPLPYYSSAGVDAAERGVFAAVLAREDPPFSEPRNFFNYISSEQRQKLKAFDKNARTYRSDVEIALGVWKSARKDARFRDKGNVWEVVRLADVLYEFQDRGGLLLASGAPEGPLRALRPDLEYHRVGGVADGRRIKRVMVKTANMATSKLNDPQRGKALFGRVLADVARRAQEFGAQPDEVAIFVAKRFAKQVADSIPGCKVGTFGAIRGQDDWMGCKVFAVIGDHFDNRDANEREAWYFGVDAGGHWLDKVACEKEQAFGRAREPQASGPDGAPLPPALMLCYGNVVPNRWPGRCQEEQWAEVAPPPVPSKLDRAELQRLKAAGMTQSAVAKTLGVSLSTVDRHWRKAG